jgi:hypothetical protein
MQLAMGKAGAVLNTPATQQARLLELSTSECKDHVHSLKWQCAQLSRDGEYICGGALVRDRHIIHLWESSGAHMASVLEGPQVALVSVAWHPDPSRCGPPIALVLVVQACIVDTSLCGLESLAWRRTDALSFGL